MGVLPRNQQALWTPCKSLPRNSLAQKTPCDSPKYTPNHLQIFQNENPTPRIFHMKKNGKPHNHELKCESCEDAVFAKGKCRSHYNKSRYVPRQAVKKPWHVCDIESCGRKTRNENHLCPNHNAHRNKYKLGVEEYLAIMVRGECEVCRGTDRLVIDHNHETGDVRGVLCARCNTALGMLAESEDRMRNLIEYVKAHV